MFSEDLIDLVRQSDYVKRLRENLNEEDKILHALIWEKLSTDLLTDEQIRNQAYDDSRALFVSTVASIKKEIKPDSKARKEIFDVLDRLGLILYNIKVDKQKKKLPMKPPSFSDDAGSEL